jgi:hypothetical protein
VVVRRFRDALVVLRLTAKFLDVGIGFGPTLSVELKPTRLSRPPLIANQDLN